MSDYQLLGSLSSDQARRRAAFVLNRSERQREDDYDGLHACARRLVDDLHVVSGDFLIWTTGDKPRQLGRIVIGAVTA